MVSLSAGCSYCLLGSCGVFWSGIRAAPWLVVGLRWCPLPTQQVGHQASLPWTGPSTRSTRPGPGGAGQAVATVARAA